LFRVALETLCLVAELVGDSCEFIRLVVQLGRLLKFPFRSFLVDVCHWQLPPRNAYASPLRRLARPRVAAGYANARGATDMPRMRRGLMQQIHIWNGRPLVMFRLAFMEIVGADGVNASRFTVGSPSIPL
jgi:hypothetical protein